VAVGPAGVPQWRDSFLLLGDAGVYAVHGHRAVVEHDMCAFCS
jgi:hypothetical protein